MSLQNISIESISKSIENVIATFPIFSNYKLIKTEVSIEKTPVKVTNYDFLFVSVIDNRWFFFRIQDYYNYQKLILWLNKLNDKRNVNFDICSYFIKELGDTSLKLRRKMNIDSIAKLDDQIMNVIKYIVEKMDDNLNSIFLGKTWIDMQFDWGDYK